MNLKEFEAAQAPLAGEPQPTSANFAALSPLDFLDRSADIFPDKIAIIDGDQKVSYSDFRSRSLKLCGALQERGIGTGDVVSILCPNSSEMLEAHFGVPMAGAVVNALNTRLDPNGIAAILNHAKTTLLLLHASLIEPARAALEQVKDPPPVFLMGAGGLKVPSAYELYERVLQESAEVNGRPLTEWQSIALNYTSGTTGRPKGVLYSHRGAYLNSLGNIITFGLQPSSIYLWTLPMFHCNGWSFPWAVTGIGGMHICLPKVDPEQIFKLIEREQVTHLCAAPVVLTMLIEAGKDRSGFEHGAVQIATGGAAPPSTVIERIERIGFRVTHLYGLTESYGPSTSCMPKKEWERMPTGERAKQMARQGVRNITLAEQQVMKDGMAVPADATTIGELVLRGNTIMKGYFEAPDETERALQGGWLHTGDLAVVHPDGYVEIKDRAKDVIISGGENISSLEIEEVLYRHPAVAEAGVVAAQHEKWGETPVAFVRLVAACSEIDGQAIIRHCKEHLASFKCPTQIVFGELPKTATGKVEKFILRERARSLQH